MAFSSTNHDYRALVFGASGITGWAIMTNALTYPSPNTFTHIIGLTHRPLSASMARFPENSKIELYSGINLSKGVEEVKKDLKQVKGIEQITHVYFAAYTGHGSDYEELKSANVEILKSAVEALEVVCPKMKFFTLQTGGKAYGIEFVNEIELKVPSKETDPRIPEPYASNVFYYAQYDYVASRSISASWKFCEIRPDVIIGFVPNHNPMNMAQCVGLFLSMWRAQYGEWAEVPFPGKGPEISAWTAKRTDTSQDVLARFHLFASMHPDEVEGRAFNVADGEVVSWSSVWDGICNYFHLKGVPPNGSLTGKEWIMANKEKWAQWEQETGIKKGGLESTGWDFMATLMGEGNGKGVNRQYDLSATRAIGFTDHVDTVAGYHIAFDRMRKADIIP